MESRERVVDERGVVRIGSVVFALIQPTAGHERAFNHWYERDHYYTAGLAAPGVFSAGRFVQPESGLHLALYFVLPDHDEARVAFATEQVALATADGRMFAERDHLHTWSYRLAESWRADPVGVPPALALDHRYDGVTVAMIDGDPPELDALLAASTHEIDLVLTLSPGAAIMPSTWEGSVDVTRRHTLVAFHRGGAGPARETLEALPEGEGFRWIESFVPVVFGTDTHITG